MWREHKTEAQSKQQEWGGKTNLLGSAYCCCVSVLLEEDNDSENHSFASGNAQALLQLVQAIRVHVYTMGYTGGSRRVCMDESKMRIKVGALKELEKRKMK